MIIPIGPCFSFAYNITESQSLKKDKELWWKKISGSLDKYMQLHVITVWLTLSSTSQGRKGSAAAAAAYLLFTQHEPIFCKRQSLNTGILQILKYVAFANRDVDCVMVLSDAVVRVTAMLLSAAERFFTTLLERSGRHSLILARTPCQSKHLH